MNILPVRDPSKINNHLAKYLGRWQQNNSPEDLGITRFVFDLYEINRQLGYPPLIRDFKPEYGTAPWAADALASWFKYEPGMTKDDWCHVVATHREGSKTTWYSFILPVYLMLIGQHGIYFNGNLLPEFDYTVLRGKNNKEAQKRIMNINGFFNRPLLKTLFGELKPTFKEVREKEGKDSGSLLILPNGYMFECSGIEQPSRGLNLFSVRPKLFIFDDVQNKENTKTSDRRNQIDEEVMMESFGAVADEGSMIYIGNKVHRLDTLGRLLDEENPIWKKHFYTLTVKKNADGTTSPGVGDLENEVPLWNKRWTMQKVIKRRHFYESQPRLGGLRGFLKEYYNIIKSDADYKIKYYIAEYRRVHGINWLVFKNSDGSENYKNIFITMGLDPAISEKKKACDSALTALATDSAHNRYVLTQRFGKWDIHDRYFDEFSEHPILSVTSDDLVKIKRRGSVEELGRMALEFNPDAIDIEAEVGQQWTFYNETAALLKKIGYPKVPIPEKSPSEGKEEKLKQVPLMHFESGIYYLPGKIDTVTGKIVARDDVKQLENDITSFPDCPKDRLDSLYLAEQVIQFPREIPYQPLGYPKVDSDKELMRKIPVRTGLLNEYEGWITS
jgi:hypothetical protein